ncbi:hypothetical protein [Photobacterium damselae]|uniref:hypothetical protein n=1 Tax=Photobacterium damselae TaxID=38293 RepID=UPI00177E6AE0|nr:hypothetical protein [Photobacterium damselae]
MTQPTEKLIKVNITRLGGPLTNGEGVWATFLSDAKRLWFKANELATSALSRC